MSTVTLPPNPRPANWKTIAPSPPQGTTFGAQQSLPKLPVLPLAPTLAKLKESIRPLAHSAEEYAAAANKVDAFAASEEAKTLQSRLEARGQDPRHKIHWLEEWWDDSGYQGYRDSVVVNVSYFYGFGAHPSHLPQTPVARAAGLARAALTFRYQLQRGQVKPDATKEGPICMDTYRWMFDCCRVPGAQGLDWSVSHASQPTTLGHIVVMRKNRFWKIDGPTDGSILSTVELEKQFQHIYDNSNREYPGVGVLTASNRDVWSKDYVELASLPHNASIMHEINSSAFFVCLDDAKPTTSIAFSRALWHGDVVDSVPVGLRNRWVDKPVQFIVFDDGQAGIMGEHSVMDGTPTVTLCDTVLDMLADKAFDHGSPVSSAIPSPTPLDFELTSTTLAAIKSAELAASTLVTDQLLNFRQTSYGKNAIKAFGVSPDSWTQLIIQLAYARFLKQEGKLRAGATYEAATTRKFVKGRTEAIRVVSSESDAWVASMDDASVSDVDRKALFSKATAKHVALAKEAGNGKGVDRHLFGLKKLLKEGEPMPEVFTDPLVARSSNWVLSTSAVFSKHFKAYGWGEVVPEGFGVAYMTGFENYLQFTVTSRKEMDNDKFCDEIDKAAQDLYELHAGQAQSLKSKL